jgi:hypothetical protein
MDWGPADEFAGKGPFYPATRKAATARVIPQTRMMMTIFLIPLLLKQDFQ